MQQIVKDIIAQSGNNIIITSSFVSWMDDKGAFIDVDNKPYRYIFRHLVNAGYTKRILAIGSWNNEMKQLCHDIAQQTAFDLVKVEYAMQCIAYGLGWLTSIRNAETFSNTSAQQLTSNFHRTTTKIASKPSTNKTKKIVSGLATPTVWPDDEESLARAKRFFDEYFENLSRDANGNYII